MVIVLVMFVLIWGEVEMLLWLFSMKFGCGCGRCVSVLCGIECMLIRIVLLKLVIV